MGRQFSFWVLLGFVTLFAVSFHDVQVNADVGPTESECRPYIEKALNELKTGEISEGDDVGGSKETEISTEDTGGETPTSAEDAITEETTEQADQVSGEEADVKGDSQEETEDHAQSTEVEVETTSVEDQQESQEQSDDQKASAEGSQEQPEDAREDETGDSVDSKEHEEETVSEGEQSQEVEKSTEDGEAETTEEEGTGTTEEVVSGEQTDHEEKASAEERDASAEQQDEVVSTEKEEEKISTEQDGGASAEEGASAEQQEGVSAEQQEGVSAEQQEEASTEQQEGPSEEQQEGASAEQQEESAEQQDEASVEQQEEVSTEKHDEASAEKQEDEGSQEEADQKATTSAEDQEIVDTQSEENQEEESAQAVESAEDATHEDGEQAESTEDKVTASEEVEATTAEQAPEESQEEVEQSVETEEPTTEEDNESAEVKSRKRRSLDDDESGGAAKVSEQSAEVSEGDTQSKEEVSVEQQEGSEEAADKSTETKADQPEESEETKSETKDEADSKEEGKDETEEGESSEKEEEEEEEEAESRPEDDLLLEFEIPENLRDRKHINELLHLDDEFEEKEKAIDNVAEVILRDLKRIYDNAIKPLEVLYKYRDLSNRHFGDPEIFAKPLILFMGPWSGGKSSIINYLTDNEYTVNSLRTGADPSPAYFNILTYGNETEILDGTQLAADYTFSGLQKFGQGLQDRLHGLKLPSKLLEKVNIVEIPGILEVRKQVSRLFPFNDACQWFIDRADVIFLIYDPSKLDVGPETEAILDQLKGREYQTRIILNKADQIKPEELLPVQSALIWNISPLMSSAQPPTMYTTSLWSHPYDPASPVRLLQAQERAFLRDIRSAIDKRIENKIASARRFAVRVRNHAKMVDCYLTTYYNHKTLFGNKKRISDEIIDHPQNYHIYEGLSTLTNISRYDLPDPEVYRDFFRLNPLYEFKKLSETCTYFRGCPINKLDVAIAYDLPELVGKYKKTAEAALNSLESSSNDNEMEKNKS